MAPLCRTRTLCVLYTRTQAQENSPPAPAHSRHAFAPQPTGCETSSIFAPHSPYLIAAATVHSVPFSRVFNKRKNKTNSN